MANLTERDMTLDSAGEERVLRAILSQLRDVDGVTIGPGDDAAVVSQPDGRTVITTDLMIDGPDFRLAWSSPYDLGWKAAASNLADIAAMGAKPTGLVMGLAAPGATTIGFLEDIARGFVECCDALAPGSGLVGGDLSVSTTLTLAVTAFGDLLGCAPARRSGATPGDVLALAGRAGWAATGLAMLFNEGVDDEGLPDAGRAAALRAREPRLVTAQLRPEPPIGAGVVAAASGVHAMMDVSDGLLLDASRLAAASGCGLEIDSDALLSSGVSRRAALLGGEDHALLAAFPPDLDLPEPFRRIGRVTERSGISVDGSVVDTIVGWDPYAGWDGIRE